MKNQSSKQTIKYVLSHVNDCRIQPINKHRNQRERETMRHQLYFACKFLKQLNGNVCGCGKAGTLLLDVAGN